MLSKKIGIDLGSDIVRMSIKSDAVIVAEPALIAWDSHGDSRVHCGDLAVQAIQRHPDTLYERPFGADGRIASPGAVSHLLSFLVTRAVGRQRIFRPDLAIAVRPRLAGPDRRLILDAAMRAGARVTYLMEGPVAAVHGYPFPAGGLEYHMVVDAGGSATDVAVVGSEGTMAWCTTRSLIQSSAENFATAGEHEEAHLVDGYRESVVAAVRRVLSEIPRSLCASIRQEGAILVGGATRLGDWGQQCASLLNMPLHSASEPELCAVRGLLVALDAHLPPRGSAEA